MQFFTTERTENTELELNGCDRLEIKFIIIFSVCSASAVVNNLSDPNSSNPDPLGDPAAEVLQYLQPGRPAFFEVELSRK